jgi:hypothetical protein
LIVLISPGVVADVTIAHDPSDLSLEHNGSTDPLSFDLQAAPASAR